jgi:hypothetical protein
MKRVISDRASTNRGSLERIANRYARLFEDAPCPPFVRRLRESEVSAESSRVQEKTDCHLSIPEIFLRLQRDEWRSHDFLVIVSFTRGSDSTDRDPSLVTYLVSPSTLRSQATITSSGVLITDVPVGRIQYSASDPWDLSVLVYRVRSNAQSQKILETLEQMIPALDYAADPFGSMIFASSILDRIHLLAQSPDAIPVLKGTSSNKADQGSSAESRYVAILQPPSELDRDRKLYVKNGHLLAGPPAAFDQRRVALEPSGRDLETASPCRFQDFALIRVGARLDRGGPTRTIHQLRRERALASASLPVREVEDHEEKSYLDRETRLRKARHLTAIFGSDGLQRMPAVAPIVIEIAGNLIPLVESAPNTLSSQFQGILNQMKDGLRYELGIEVPGVRVRGNETDLPDGTYLIMINEIPLVSGKVSLDQALCNATVEQLSSIGVKAEQAVNPANGSECGWVQKKDWETVRKEGKRIREDGLYLWGPLEYIILHLSSVIRKNAPEFLGVKAVADLLRVKDIKAVVDPTRGMDKPAYPEICTAAGGLPRFTTVLQILLEEEVPILELGAICSRYLALSATGMATHEIAEELRCLHELRPSLRYRSDSIIVYELGKNFVAMLRAGLYQSGDTAVLAIEPEPTQAALTAVRNEVTNLPPTAMNPVVLVEDWRLRRPTRKLIELEFPHLWVLARRELADLAHSVSTIGVIEID